MNENQCPHCYQPLPKIPEGMEIVWEHNTAIAADLRHVHFTPSEMRVLVMLLRESGAHIHDIARTMPITAGCAKVTVNHIRNHLKTIGFTVTNEKKTGWLEVIKHESK